ncbi:gamma BP-like protein [Perkinsela sp. CCAP 1560/4]|nr:gamma BP-like protein [Perkinsela sp. CCAP 1560/4]|eukprot:KNH09602.1 gamma BP-like protein [Perkinsela sp. CCAP 1560/4]
MLVRQATCGNALLLGTKRYISTDQKDWFAEEAVSHSRRVSWSPHTSVRRDGMVFAKLARSNFPQMEDKRVYSYESEPYCTEQIEAHRETSQPDIYLYKYSITPTHLRLRKS